MINYYQ